MKHHEQFGPGVRAIIINTFNKCNRHLIGTVLVCQSKPYQDFDYNWVVDHNLDAINDFGRKTKWIRCAYLIPEPKKNSEFESDHRETKNLERYNKLTRDIYEKYHGISK